MCVSRSKVCKSWKSFWSDSSSSFVGAEDGRAGNPSCIMLDTERQIVRLSTDLRCCGTQCRPVKAGHNVQQKFWVRVEAVTNELTVFRVEWKRSRARLAGFDGAGEKIESKKLHCCVCGELEVQLL